jgi:pimeloyl-ACP methyl ester carboxylesterase
MAHWHSPRRRGFAAILSALIGMAVSVPPAAAQPPAGNPNEMCGTGETFTVHLPGTSLGIDDSDGFWRRINVPATARADSVTLPKGCRIYAFLISGFGDNEGYDHIVFYKVAEFVAQNNGYVHVGWWNNFTSEYMARPLHPETITIQKMIPLLGIPIGDPVVIHPTPKTTGIPDTFLNTMLDLPKANPDEDFQFLSDAELVLKAVRQHNPHALILVVGHSMGGNAVARLGATPGVPIDLLAPIDPVGNRDMPRGELGAKNFNWTRWRAAVNFQGYKQWDCVRNALGLCADTDPSLFGVAFTCTTSTTPWLPVKPVIGSRAPLVCNRSAYVDPGTRLTIGTNVRHLYHRWQQESFWPVDFSGTERFNRPAAYPLSSTNILSMNYQAPVLAQSNPLLPNDPDKTCYAGVDPRDHTFLCNPTDGHGEIIGVRVDGLFQRVRPGLQLTSWPARSSTFTPGDRRDRLIQLALDGPSWPYRPQNPDLCLVCDDIITITRHLMAQQAEETDVDRVAPASYATLEPEANATGWVNEDVVVSINATDDRSGVHEIHVTLSGAQIDATVAFGSSTQVHITAEGLTTVSYFARDHAGNAEPVHTLDVNIDKTPPEIAALTDVAINSDGWIGSPVVVRFPASDNAGGSGLAASSPDLAVGTEGAGQVVSGTAEDHAGNVSTALLTLNVDLTPPDITFESHVPVANAAGWNNTDVTLTWACSDALSGPVLPYVSQTVSSEGAALYTLGRCTDRASNSAADARYVSVDKTAPSAIISAPANGDVFLLNAQPASHYACSDALSGVRSCSGPVTSGSAVDTTSVGSRQFTVNATDVADNTSSATHTYSVQYAFSGFANPVVAMPMRNVVNAGRTVPVKYVLRDANGALIADESSVAALASVAVACEGTAASVLAEDTTAAGSTQVRWDAAAQQFVYNWKTNRAWAGTCRVLELTLNDGTRQAAMFHFR